jgi:3-dehydrotetronate 4-kinase
MLLGAIADDFTGAGDLANTLAKSGMDTSLFIGPTQNAVDCEAGVVALKTRTVPVEEAVSRSLEAARWLMGQGCEQIIFKYCSTFDSTAQGNIGPVAEALLDFLGSDVAIVCPAFPATGRRLFMGHLFVGNRPLNESGMERHPLTPMTDPDIRRWLSYQTEDDVGLVTLDAVRSGASALRVALDEEHEAGRRLVVVDATSDDDLRTIGEAVAHHRLVTGGSGIALGLPGNFRARGLLTGRKPASTYATGRGVALCGSCSGTSRTQVMKHSEKNPGFAVNPDALMSGEVTAQTVANWVDAQVGSPIVHSDGDAEIVSAAQIRYGSEAIAGRIEVFFGELACLLADRGFRRIAVGGGETSGAVIKALGIESLAVGDEIDPGIPALSTERGGAIGLVLKSGNFGRVDFFENALRKIGEP